MLQVGQRWKRINFGPDKVLLVEIVTVSDSTSGMGKVIATKNTGHTLDTVVHCSAFPVDSYQNIYWEYLKGQDAPNA